eukprot:1202756-Rhodomonas_salina.5
MSGTDMPMSGTAVAHGRSSVYPARKRQVPTLSAYALSGTDVADNVPAASRTVRACYAMSGTDIAHGGVVRREYWQRVWCYARATRCPVLTKPSRVVLRDERY